MSDKTIVLRTALSSATLLWTVCLYAGAPLYEIHDLTPEGYTTSVAYDINSSGDAVGIAGRFPGGTFEEAFFIYDHATGTSTVFGVGAVVPRKSIIGTGFRRAAINDSGDVAATATFLGGAAEWRGFIYDGVTLENLGTLYLGPGTGSNIRPASDALDINGSGIATGTASSGAATTDNVDIYIASSAPVTDIDGDLTALTKDDLGRAINNAGLIARSNQDGKATLFSGAAETVFLSGTALAAELTLAIDLNEVGQVTGQVVLADSSFIYDTTDSSLTTISQIGTGHRMFAKGINEDGDVVGQGDRDPGLSGQARGFVYMDDDSTSYILEDHVDDLTLPVVPGLGDWERLRTAWAINDEGWIVGEGDRRFTGETFPNDRAYLLIPIPTPGDGNGDGWVDGLDYLLWASNFGTHPGADGDISDGDYNDDGWVDGLDYLLWAGNFGSHAATAVPEPSGVAMLLFCCAAVALRRS